MSVDPLDVLVESFRAETASRAGDEGALRARVLGDARLRRTRVRPHPWLVPLLAALVGSGALAATVKRLESTRREPEPAMTVARARAPGEGRGAAASPARRALPREAPTVAAPRAPVVSLESLPVDVPRPGATRTAAVSGTAEPGAPTPSTDGERSEELALYRAAHDLVHRGADATRALAAFREYLAAYPDGALSVEARFNEAACLARLGRTSDAAARLAPFAGGAHGAHLQAEARKLLARPHAER